MPLNDAHVPLPTSDRLCELAKVLARGVLRLRERPPRSLDPPPQSDAGNLSESRGKDLEVAPETVLSVLNG
jgi:hypothetical protein